MAACLAQAAAPAEQHEVARMTSAPSIGDQMPRAAAAAFRCWRLPPIGGIGRHRSGSAPWDRAPHPAHEAEAVAAHA